jgi:hypothetical protein
LDGAIQVLKERWWDSCKHQTIFNCRLKIQPWSWRRFRSLTADLDTVIETKPPAAGESVPHSDKLCVDSDSSAVGGSNESQFSSFTALDQSVANKRAYNFSGLNCRTCLQLKCVLGQHGWPRQSE